MTTNTGPSESTAEELAEVRKSLVTLGRRIKRTRAAAKDALDDARPVVVRASGLGFSQMEMSNMLHVDRVTLRAWLGIPRRPSDTPKGVDTQQG